MSVLQDPRYFPVFRLLPPDSNILEAMVAISQGAPVNPTYHWCFMGEIVDDTLAKESFLRHRLLVRDREGLELPVLFYLSAGDNLDTSHLKTGHTIFVRYAQHHWFLDLTEGIRVEKTAFFYAVPYSLSAILETHSALTPGVCKSCGKQASQRCAKCKQTSYCSRECQTSNWSDHRTACRLLTAVASVTTLDYTQLDRYVPFR
ncbi:MAG: hypothetical protein J3Q66DRAFT_386081 [Benniella sp.]|nr:MAG: hypothetical protein J3Q66DRAFT_386081 [Benniella sp.]